MSPFMPASIAYHTPLAAAAGWCCRKPTLTVPRQEIADEADHCLPEPARRGEHVHHLDELDRRIEQDRTPPTVHGTQLTPSFSSVSPSRLSSVTLSVISCRHLEEKRRSFA